MSEAIASKIEELRRQARLEPDSPEAHYRLGTALCRTRNLAEAELVLRRAIELRPDDERAWVNLGGVLLSRFDFSGSIDANAKAAALHPDLVQPHFNAGIGHMYLGQTEAMAACFERVLALDPVNAGGHYHLAAALYALGQIDAARPHLNLALALGYPPQPELVRAIGKAGQDPAKKRGVDIEVQPQTTVELDQEE